MKKIIVAVFIPFKWILFNILRILPRSISGRLYILSGIMLLSAISTFSSCRVIGRRSCYDVTPVDTAKINENNPPPGVKCYDRAMPVPADTTSPRYKKI
ncbi:MAG: hypothetical protein V2A54_09010 [Bacteroidota bacterium]